MTYFLQENTVKVILNHFLRLLEVNSDNTTNQWSKDLTNIILEYTKLGDMRIFLKGDILLKRI